MARARWVKDDSKNAGDILHALTVEHAEILQLMNRLVAGELGESRRVEQYPIVRDRIRAYSVAESLDFFLPLTAYARLKRSAQEGIDRREEIEQALDHLDSLAPDALGWQEAFTELRDRLQRQFRSEETELFPQVREFVKERDLRTFGESFRESRARLILM